MRHPADHLGASRSWDDFAAGKTNTSFVIVVHADNQSQGTSSFRRLGHSLYGWHQPIRTAARPLCSQIGTRAWRNCSGCSNLPTGAIYSLDLLQSFGAAGSIQCHLRQQ